MLSSDGSDKIDSTESTLERISSKVSTVSKKTSTSLQHNQSSMLLKKNSSVGDGTEYIKSISGVQKEIESNSSSVIGKLLVKEEDEDLTPDSKTYRIIASMVGGLTFASFYVGF